MQVPDPTAAGAVRPLIENEGQASGQRPSKKFRTTEVPQAMPKRPLDKSLFDDDEDNPNEHQPKRVRPPE
eukprot:3917737-Karenia_brevis.AAC.1